jgi:hypothetical protein
MGLQLPHWAAATATHGSNHATTAAAIKQQTKEGVCGKQHMSSSLLCVWQHPYFTPVLAGLLWVGVIATANSSECAAMRPRVELSAPTAVRACHPKLHVIGMAPAGRQVAVRWNPHLLQLLDGWLGAMPYLVAAGSVFEGEELGVSGAVCVRV